MHITAALFAGVATDEVATKAKQGGRRKITSNADLVREMGNADPRALKWTTVKTSR